MHLRNVYRNMIFISLVGYTMESFKFLGEGGGAMFVDCGNHEHHENWAIANSIDSTLYGPRWKLFLMNKLREIYTEKNFYCSHYNIGMLPKQQLNRWNTETKPQNDTIFACKNLWENRNIHDI